MTGDKTSISSYNSNAYNSQDRTDLSKKNIKNTKMYCVNKQTNAIMYI